MNLRASVPPVLPPQVFSGRSETPPGPKTAPEPLPGPPLVRSRLSIDSDSDMTESVGLLQEVSMPPLIVFIIGKRRRGETGGLQVVSITWFWNNKQNLRGNALKVQPGVKDEGGPGSGKGSQAARLAQRFRFRVLSLDELLRRQLLSHASPGRKWEVISEMMGHGELGLQTTSANPLLTETRTTSANPLLTETQTTSGNPLLTETQTTSGNPLLTETQTTSANPLLTETQTTSGNPPPD
ncbi:hypothetical protein NQZ68_027059 [Dissostichus eleginoides]|nr:hypothetical protein NQZ68_027059 [Dissostichus eleginoides]